MGVTGAIVVGSLVSAGTSLYSGYKQSEAIKKESEFSANQSEMNSRIAEVQAADAISRGDKEAGQHRVKAGQVVGSQRAGFASQGIDVNSGSAAQVQSDTKYMGEQDVMTIKNNAWREAWGYKVEAQNHAGTAAMTRTAGENKANNTLLTGKLQALNTGISGASMYYGAKK